MYALYQISSLYFFAFFYARWLRNVFRVGRTRKQGRTLGTLLDPKMQKPGTLQPQQPPPPTKHPHQLARKNSRARLNNPPNWHTPQALPPNANTGNWQWTLMPPKWQTEARRAPPLPPANFFFFSLGFYGRYFLNIIIMQHRGEHSEEHELKM